jgi:hypothetical protein
VKDYVTVDVPELRPLSIGYLFESYPTEKTVALIAAIAPGNIRKAIDDPVEFRGIVEGLKAERKQMVEKGIGQLVESFQDHDHDRRGGVVVPKALAKLIEGDMTPQRFFVLQAPKCGIESISWGFLHWSGVK